MFQQVGDEGVLAKLHRAVSEKTPLPTDSSGRSQIGGGTGMKTL
jgi:hypothetical protein